jgi:hypothetical protein
MDILDSRQLTNHDGFVQLFAQDDVYEYHVTSMPRGVAPQHEPAFELEVKTGGKQKGSGAQHQVMVSWDQRGSHYVAKPARLEISQNDFVIWHCERMVGSPPFRVVGKGRKGSFDSASLGPNAVFTHVFLEAGLYTYQVNGVGAFEIDVTDHRKVARDVYLKQAATAPVVLIKGGKPDQDRLEIVAGQTVVWAVENDAGVVIKALPTAQGRGAPT